MGGLTEEGGKDVRRFTLHEPASVQEASQLLSRYGDEAKAFAGGTELLMLVKLGVLHPAHLINLKGARGLKGIRYDQATGWLRIGALATHREVELSPVVQEHLPIFSQMEREVANVRVRNMGTIAGNLCFLTLGHCLPV
jgi:carbon-monoxide dehydrogenase medium subunit